jgi:hypothetical protein
MRQRFSELIPFASILQLPCSWRRRLCLFPPSSFTGVGENTRRPHTPSFVELQPADTAPNRNTPRLKKERGQTAPMFRTAHIGQVFPVVLNGWNDERSYPAEVV